MKKNQLIVKKNIDLTKNNGKIALEPNFFETENQYKMYMNFANNYIPESDEYIFNLGYNVENIPGLKKTYYKGCLYLGYDINPYYMLYDIEDDNMNVLEFHQDTVLVNEQIQYKEHIYEFEKIIINEIFSGHLYWNNKIRVETVVIKSKNNIFKGNSLFGFRAVKYICAPYFKLSDFYESKLKPYLVAGYLKMIDEGSDLSDEIKESYQKYIFKYSSKLYNHSFDVPLMLDYLIDERLIKKEHLYELVKRSNELNSKEVLFKLESYANKYFGISLENIQKTETNFIEIEQEIFDKNTNTTTIVAIEPSQISAVVKPFRIFKGKNANYIYDNGDEFDMPAPLRRKYETYLRGMINKGDLYVARYKNEVLVIKVIEKGNKMFPRFKFEVVDYYEITDHTDLLTMYNEQTNQLEEVNRLVKDGCGFVIFNSFLNNNRITADGLELYPEYGLFKYNYYNGQLYAINNLINNNDIIIDRLAISFFENYFLLPVPDELIDESFNPYNDDLNYVVFRKVYDPNKIQEQVVNLNCDLLVDAIDLKCAIQSPYTIVDDIDGEVVNCNGNKYLVKDVFKYISTFLTLGNRNATSTQIISIFSDFYQRKNEIKYEGFTSEDIMNFTNKYFMLDVVDGTYLAHDVIIEKDNKCICYDRNWFNIFYDSVKKSKTVIRKCSDILIPYNKKRFFRKFTLNEEEILFYTECVKKTVSFEQFCDLLEDYYSFKYKY